MTARRRTPWLADHLDGALDLAHLADVACMSPYHFHRIYHAMQGETVAATVRRLRLHRAAVELIAGALPVRRHATRQLPRFVRSHSQNGCEGNHDGHDYHA